MIASRKSAEGGPRPAFFGAYRKPSIAAGRRRPSMRPAFLMQRCAMDFLVILCGGLAAACLVAAHQSWRDREHKYDVAILGLTGGGFGIGLIAAVAA
jgi:hypothetical protein